KKRMFVCNKCNIEKSPETVCSHCRGWNLISLGIGTETISQEIRDEFPQAKILKLDKESVKSARDAEKIVEDFESTHGAVLIGTEMAFFYLKERVHLSIVASFDSLWSIPDFRMGERILQLFISIISKTETKILIRTKNAQDSSLLAIKSENMLPFIREELKDREKLGYPPFKRFIKITCVGEKKDSPDIKRYLEEYLKDYNPEIFSGFVSKNTNEYAINALLKVDPKDWSLPDISIGSTLDKNLKKLLSSIYLPMSSSLEISVDPENLL
ncbi:MAG: hypothetical protein AAB873_00220, partial [Patescibacteria group bacterium]